MTTSKESEGTKRKNEEETNIPRRTGTFESFLRGLERNLERAFARTWHSAHDWRFRSLPFKAMLDIRAPIFDMLDRGDRYQLQVEVPGIEKERIDLKAMRYAIEISGEQSEKIEEKGKNYVYKEHSYRSLRRRIPIPEEIVPSKVNAKMVNGVLNIELPKKVPTRVEDETTKFKAE